MSTPFPPEGLSGIQVSTGKSLATQRKKLLFCGRIQITEVDLILVFFDMKSRIPYCKTFSSYQDGLDLLFLEKERLSNHKQPEISTEKSTSVTLHVATCYFERLETVCIFALQKNHLVFKSVQGDTN